MNDLEDYFRQREHETWGLIRGLSRSHTRDHHTLDHGTPRGLPKKRSLYTALTGIPDLDLTNFFTENGEVKENMDHPIVY